MGYLTKLTKLGLFRVFFSILVQGVVLNVVGQSAVPQIEWTSTSPMRSNLMFIRIYEDGTVTWPNRTNAVLRRLRTEEVKQLIERMEAIGFLEIDQEKVNMAIAKASGREYQGRKSSNKAYPPGDLIIDGGTSSLIVRTPLITNHVTFFSVGNYSAAYPQIRELKTFQKALELVHGAAMAQSTNRDWDTQSEPKKSSR